MNAGLEINNTLTGNALVTPAYINVAGPLGDARVIHEGSWYLRTNDLNGSISFVKDVTVIKRVLKSIPPLTPLTFVSTKDLHLSVEKVQAGAQQLLLSLGKHSLFVFFYGKYDMLYKCMEMARIWGLALLLQTSPIGPIHASFTKAGLFVSIRLQRFLCFWY